MSDPDWASRAACRGHPDPDFWFASSRSPETYEAQRWCARCPVARECLATELAIEARVPGDAWGLYGGLTADERRKLLSSRTNSVPPQCS